MNRLHQNNIGLHRPFVIAQVKQENYRTRTIFFEEGLESRPGQFVMAWLPGIDEKPFSIAGKEPLRLTVVSVGSFSTALNSLSPGSRVWIRGPLGKGYQIEGKKLLLVGGGYGVAPLLFLAKEARKQNCDVEVCIGARSAQDVLLLNEFSEINVPVAVTTEDGSAGMQGVVTQAMELVIRDRKPDCVYGCGPVKMLEVVEQQCIRHRLAHQLSWEAHMRCGVGLCGSCELIGPPENPAHGKGWLVCLDGPVSIFRFDDTGCCD